MDFWDRVNTEIRAQKTTQEWVASSAGIVLGTMRGWIAKDIFPRADEGRKIAKALNVSLDFLVDGAEGDPWAAENQRLIGSARRLSGDRLAVLTMIAETLAANPPAVSTGRVPVPSAAQLERELRDGLGLVAERPAKGYGP